MDEMCRRDEERENQQVKTAGSDEKVLTFLIGRETYGLPVSVVDQIIRVPEIRPVPDTPAHMVGVINYRGEIIPVLGLRLRFEVDDESDPQKNSIIIVLLPEDDKMVKHGILVDMVLDIVAYSPVSRDYYRVGANAGDDNVVEGTVLAEGEVIIILDVHKLLTTQ